MNLSVILLQPVIHFMNLSVILLQPVIHLHEFVSYSPTTRNTFT